MTAIQSRPDILIYLLLLWAPVRSDDLPLQTIADFGRHASEHLPPAANDFYSSGAMFEQTLHDNMAAFSRYRIIPRLMNIDIRTRDLRTTVLGQQVPFPIGLSPTGFTAMAHPEAENGIANAAKVMNTLMVLSSFSSKSLESVAEAAPGGRRWFQLYMMANYTATERLVRRAEAAGFSAIVVTMDATVLGKRIRHVNAPSVPPLSEVLGNFETDAALVGYKRNNMTLAAYGKKFLLKHYDRRVFDWLKSITDLPIIAKGILSVEDAVAVVKAGVSAIVVSNHGGRQLDGVPATIDVLSDIVSAVGHKVEVYLDGGIRTGTDVMKALALGARFVFVGRPTIWGLVYNGSAGVAQVLTMLKDELDVSMALAGKNSVSDLQPNLLRKDSC